MTNERLWTRLTLVKTSTGHTRIESNIAYALLDKSEFGKDTSSFFLDIFEFFQYIYGAFFDVSPHHHQRAEVMATRIEIEYDRQFTDSQVQAIAARGTNTIDVMDQLGAAYQGLPGIAMAPYQTEVDSLQADLVSLQALQDQIRPLLISIDAKAPPLDEKNKAALRTLDGLLRTDADRALLAQITGPTAQPSPPPTPPGP